MVRDPLQRGKPQQPFAPPRAIVAVAALILVGTAIVGIPVAESLSGGGMRDQTSESSQAARLLAEKFDQGDMTMVLSVTSNDGVDIPAARSVGTDIVRRLQNSPHVGQVASPWAAAPRAWSARTARRD